MVAKQQSGGRIIFAPEADQEEFDGARQRSTDCENSVCRTGPIRASALEILGGGVSRVQKKRSSPAFSRQCLIRPDASWLEERQPATALGVTDHISTIAELVTYRPRLIGRMCRRCRVRRQTQRSGRVTGLQAGRFEAETS